MTDFDALTETGLGVVGLRVGAAATLYLRDSASPDARGRIASWLDAERERHGDALRWSRNERSGRWQKAARSKAVATWLSERMAAKSWELLFHGGDDARDASDVLLRGFGTADWNGGWGYLRWARPGAEVEADPGEFREQVIAAAAALRPSHGYAGWTVLESPEIEFEQAFQPALWALAQRHVGLEVGAPLSFLDYVHDAIIGAAWLVVLDEGWLERCPEVRTLERQEGVEVHGYAGGVVIQAGPGPILGGPLGEEVDGGLRAVAQALAPIRLRTHPGLHFAGPDRMHARETQRWLGRFDP